MAESSLPNNATEEKKDGKTRIDWDIIGISSTAISLLGIVFFVVGYSYEAAWYAYFGISITEFDIPIQRFLLQSIPAILIVLSIFGVTFWILMWIAKMLAGRVLPEYSQYPSIIYEFSKYQWSPVAGVTLFILTIIAVSISTNTTLAIELESFPLMIIVFIILMTIGSMLSRLGKSKNTSLWLTNSLFSLSILLCSIVLSIGLGRSSAQYGLKIFKGGWTIQESYLLSKDEIFIFDDLKSVCPYSGGNCYGPFGVIADTEKSIYLIPWPQTRDFPANSSVHIVPKTSLPEYYFFQPAPSPVPTATPTPTQTSTSSPVPTSTTIPMLPQP